MRASQCVLQAAVVLSLCLAVLADPCVGPCNTFASFPQDLMELRLTAFLSSANAAPAVVSAEVAANGTLYVQYMDTSSGKATMQWHSFVGPYSAASSLQLNLFDTPGFLFYTLFDEDGLVYFDSTTTCSTGACCCSQAGDVYSSTYYCQCWGEGLIINASTSTVSFEYYCLSAESTEVLVIPASLAGLNESDIAATANFVPIDPTCSASAGITIVGF